MEKTRARIFREMLEEKGVSSKTARQAAVTIDCDMYGTRTERGQRLVRKAWTESQENG